MRVSDWSDGVCSSDLTAAFAGTGLSWLLFDATFAGGAADCRLASGACWPFLRENARLILFGPYPEVEQWRSAAAAAALPSGLAFSVGRASGRDSVCKSLSIPVGAATRNKPNKH